MGAAAALGINMHRRNPLRRSALAIAVMMLLKTPQGWKEAFALIDSGAEANFINQCWVKENDLPDIDDLPREILALDGHYIKAYSHRTLEVQATDSNSVARSRAHAFEAVDLHGYDIILGYPWLQVVNPDIDWPVKTWSYRTKDGADLIEIIDAETLAKDLAEGCAAFAITPRRLASGKPMALFAAAVSENRIPGWLRDLEDVFSEKEAANIHDPALV